MKTSSHIHHIMWQPTANCSCKCAGCYVPKMKQDNVDIEIALAVFSRKETTCNQFTLSADDLTQMPKELKDCVRGIWKKYPDNTLPMLCVTAHSWNTVQRWARDLDMSVDEFLQPISILSLSTFPSLGKNISFMIEQCHQHDTKVNYNYMVKGGEENSKPFEMGCRYADQVYLVMKKAPLGQVQDPQDFANWLKARKLAKQWKVKNLVEDTCVLDSVHYLHTKQPCSAWKDKVHVWPNRTVTGCPYDSHQTCGNMDSCKIFEVVEGVHKSSISPLQTGDVRV